ncbi:aminotransferase class I/II-fold pyridoxal phosphate-dependent enzyme [Achromobacter aloeverae]|uniref:8-amino-7-oxononanoate synthase n=1 Tax=Achromobacter aloeverae TaxID=1750518 RepID=A0A4Q1HDG4_9BURK|nr:8-amino-7-oxononanoate synthase [Achromobacter aloeverae]RXN83951.1 8-amino-7-oxononanoate synthase [Achromobacter aloeverae]
MHPLEVLRAGLADLQVRGLHRRRRISDTPCAPRIRIDGRDVVAFASNDYLGLANHPELIEALSQGARQYGAGSGGSHLLGGHSRAHALLEDTLAEYCGGFARNPRALTFSTGYMANIAMLAALAGPGATLYSDALNHASLIDGARLARADVRIYPHGDAAALGEMLAADAHAGVKIIVTDAVFSMDGDIAPLADLLALAERHQAWLAVDDAHGFGVQGSDGAGSVAALGLRSPLLVYMGTLGKAAGVAGAFIVAEETVIEWLIQRARTYIYTTAAAPALAHAAISSIGIMRGGDGQARRARLAGHIEMLSAAIGTRRTTGTGQASGLPRAGAACAGSETACLPRSSTAIQPVLVGANQAALDLAETLLAQGFWAPAVRPPTVPPGTARLRLSLSAAHEPADIERFIEVLSAS